LDNSYTCTTDPAVEITGDGTLFDLNDFVLTGDTGNPPSAGVGILISDGLFDVSVYDGEITGYQTGIVGSDLSNGLFADLSFSTCEYGIFLSVGQAITVRSSEFDVGAVSNGGTGIIFEKVMDTDIIRNEFVISDTETSGVVLEDCTVGKISLNSFFFPSTSFDANDPGSESNTGVELSGSTKILLENNCFFGPPGGTILPRTQGINVDNHELLTGPSGISIEGNSFQTLDVGVRLEADEGTNVVSNCFTNTNTAIFLTDQATKVKSRPNGFFNNAVDIRFGNGSTKKSKPVALKGKYKRNGFCPCKANKATKAPSTSNDYSE